MARFLDRPAWTALTTRHAHLAEGGELARRYDPSIVPFAATLDDGAECLAALASLASPGEMMLFLQADPVALPANLTATLEADGVQMIAREHLPEVEDPLIVQLGEVDAADMLELATLTKPGPFTLKALRLGGFWGIRRDGRLVAMAGERMKQPGFTEISGVCTHPDARGNGYARLLSLFVAGRIAARGKRPYLHAWASNAAAIRLYESLGFTRRRTMHVTMAVRTS
ncbi:GNAT family N-acetyltransferase [Aquibium sp. LZ166]|uniref:GNAT family N-acetyltransferase n=1 Tax=Aquibium pacificus TaxID=3153579 RepID=A0ABV3STG6_9HYPH